MGQCYRALLQTNGEAAYQMNNTVWWNINHTEIIGGKLDFIIEHMKAEMMPEGGVPIPWPQDGGEVDLSQREFLRDLGVLDEKIDQYTANAARDTSGDHLTYGDMLSAEERGHLSEQERDKYIERGAPFTSTTTLHSPPLCR